MALSCGAAVVSGGEDYRLGSPERAITGMSSMAGMPEPFTPSQRWGGLCPQLLEIHLGNKVQWGSQQLQTAAECTVGRRRPVPSLV